MPWLEKICPFCNKSYKTYPSIDAKFCSSKCYHKYVSINKSGKNSYNYKGKIVKWCLNCGNIFEVYEYRKNTAITCSKKCFYDLWRKGMFKKERREIEKRICKYCHKIFDIWKCRLKRKDGFDNVGTYCSMKCVRNDNKRIGENNNRWKGGISSEREKIRGLPEFREWRKSVFKRDSFTCQICKSNKIRPLNAHHINSFSDNPDLRFKIDNGITFCEPCHKNTHKKEQYASN